MSKSMRSLRRKPLSVFVQIALPTMLAMSLGHAATCTVNSALDDPLDASAKVNDTDSTNWTNWGAGATGAISLRDCIVAANLMTGATGAPNGMMTVDTSAIAGSTIALGDSLPLIFNNTTIGGNGNPVTVDGGGAHRIFFVSGLPDSNVNPPPDPDGAQTITVGLSNLILQNGKAQGGNGNAGGMGAGGALFVNKNATVTVNQVDVKNNSANGGAAATGGTASGGGGLGGNADARGGGGIFGNTIGAGSFSGGGGVGTDAPGNAGGGFGGTGVGQLSNSQGFAAPTFGGGASFGSPDGGIGGGGYRYGAGGFGGGGGTSSTQYISPGVYGATSPGGFGGGGGSYGEGGGGGAAGGFGGGAGNMGSIGSSYAAPGPTGVSGAAGGFGAGGGGGGGGGGCFDGASGPTGPFPGGTGGTGGPGGVGGGIGASGSDGNSCSPGNYGSHGSPGAGGGGGGLGGGVFVRAGGTLLIQSNSQVAGGSTVSGNTVTAGAGGAPGGTGATGSGGNGAAAGSGMFLMSGSTTTFDIGTTETISNSIQDDSVSSLPFGQSYTPGDGSGAAITKQGAGTLIFGNSAVDTYAGSTTINAGTLQLDGFLTASSIDINSGGTLSGAGGTAAGVTLNAGGVVAPGDSPGTLSGGSLTWNGDGTDQMAWQLGADSTPANTDLLVLNSDLTKGTGTTFKFHFTDGGGGAPTPGTTYTLIRYTSTSFSLDASDFSFDYNGALAGGLQGTFSLTGSVSPPPAPIKNAPTAGLPPNALQFTAAALAPTISKAFGDASIPLSGGTTSLSFHIVNPNASVPLSGITFTDNLPAGLVVSTPPNVNNACGGTFTATAAASSVDLSGGALAGGANCDISLEVAGTTAGVKANTTGAISASGPITGTTSNTANLTVVAPPGFQKAFNPAAIGPAGTSTLTFTISNANASGLSGVAFSDAFPAGLEVAAVPNATDTCGGTFTAAAATGSVSLTNGSVAANASCTLSVDVHGTTTGTKDNTTGTIFSVESGTGGTAAATLTVNVTPVRLQSFDVE